jgi:hypothetical protein
MNKVSKFVAISCAATVAAFAVAGSASAQEWHHRHDGGDALAAGVVGLAAGMIAGAAIASPPPPRRYYYYDDAPRRVYYRPAYVYERPVYVGGYEPWSRSWYRYCSNRYRSFDPQSGTFVGYDGREHFCR